MAFRPGPENPKWNGGRWRDSKGYWCVWVGIGHPCAISGRGFCREHTLAFWKANGRLPRRGFDIHHVDRNKDNNDPSNLKEKRHDRHAWSHAFDY